MTTKKFIIKTAIKIFIYAIISTIAFNFLTGPIITNELALGQMENSNELYVLMDSYNYIKTIASVIYGFITVIFVATVTNNVYDFIKTRKNKGEN